MTAAELIQSQNMIDQCVTTCLESYQACLDTISHCMERGGVHIERKNLVLMMECAEICRSATMVMKLKGEFAPELCALTAKVCEACAESCASIDDQDEVMKQCAEACFRCAETCRQMTH